MSDKKRMAVKAKCGLYKALLELYDGETVIDSHDIVLMDALMRDKDIQKVLSDALSK